MSANHRRLARRIFWQRRLLARTPRAVALLCLTTLGLAGALFALLQPSAPARAQLPAAMVAPPPTLPNGVAAGDVTQDAAILWARSSATGALTVTYGVDLDGDANTITASVFDARAPVTVAPSGLTPATPYRYRVTNAAGESAEGRFRTAASAGRRTGLRFGASGDWRGDLSPFPAVVNAPARALDFFVALGDTVYADFASPAVPLTQATTLGEFRLKQSEVYSARVGLNALADLRASTALFAVIDDHEVTNDFAGGASAATDARFAETAGFINDTQLFENGLRAFQEYNPLQGEFYGDVSGNLGGDGRMDNERKLYRYRRFGDDAALFVLDSRSFRDQAITALDVNDAADVDRFLAEAFAPGRTLLGAQQLQDLQADLLDAQQRGILWKFVAVPEPIQHLGPANAQDRFEGYAAERTALLRFIEENDISNVVFIAADVHGTIVNNVTYQDDVGQPQIATDAFEVTTGAVAFDAPFGPTAVQFGVQSGVISPSLEALYNFLPLRPDADSEVDDKDDFIKAALDQQLLALGYDPVGLAGSSINATLVQGDYIAVHTYGWTEFEIASDTGRLTVTTYGIDAYAPSDLAADPAAVAARTPRIVSQFTVEPASPTAGATVYLPIVPRE